MYNYPITKYMGIVLIIMGLLDLLGLIYLSPIFLMGFSLTALLLTFIDLLEFKADEQEDPFKFRKIKSVILFLAIISFLLIPNLSIDWSDFILTKLNNILILCSIGVLFIILGLKQEKVASSKLESIIEKVTAQAVDIALKEKVEQVASEVLEKENLKGIINELISEIDSKRKNNT